MEAGGCRQLAAIGVGVVAGVRLGRCHAGTEAAGAEAILGRVDLVAEALGQVLTVGVGVVAAVRLGRQHALCRVK